MHLPTCQAERLLIRLRSSVVELCANGPLMTLGMGQHEAPVDEQTARNYFRQIVLAIEYLHCNGIVSIHLISCT